MGDYWEKIRYGVVLAGTQTPEKVRYINEREAREAAERFSERENKKYCVVEIVECISVI